MLNSQDPSVLAPQGGEWLTFPAGSVGVNNTFGGYEGNFTSTPEWVYNREMRVYVVNNRVTHVEIPSRNIVFRHQNFDGQNIHGGNHTTSEWFTFDISGFWQIGTDGLITSEDGIRGIELRHFPGFNNGNTLTPRYPLPAPCFGPDVIVNTKEKGKVKVKYLKARMHIEISGYEYREILWVGGKEVKVTDKNAPILVKTERFSPLHRIFSPTHKAWVIAKNLEKVGLAQKANHNGTQEYFHILLDDHYSIPTQWNVVESLLPTDRALSGMDQEMAAEIKEIVKNREYSLKYPEVKAKDLK